MTTKYYLRRDTTVTNNMNAIAWLRKRLEDSDSEIIREMAEEAIAKLMSAGADGVVAQIEGAG